MAAITWPSNFKIARFTPGRESIEVISQDFGYNEEALYRDWRWTCAVTFAPQSYAEYQALMAFDALIQGPSGTLEVPWMSYRSQIGNGTGTVTVSAARVAGSTTIPTTGWGGSDPRLGAGAMIHYTQPGSTPRMHVVLANANGTSPTLSVWPPLREALAVGDSIKYTVSVASNNFVRCVMRPVGLGDFGTVSPVGDSTGTKQIMEGITFSFVESVRKVY